MTKTSSLTEVTAAARTDVVSVYRDITGTLTSRRMQLGAIADLPPGGGRAVMPALLEANSAAANGALLTAAVAEAEAVDGVVVMPPGEFPMSCSLTTGCVIDFGSRCRLVQSYGSSVISIDLTGDAVGPYTITAFSSVVHPDNVGSSTALVTRITLSTPADTANFQTGDAVLVSSQDTRTYYTGDTNYAGETAVVQDIDGVNGYVYLRGELTLASLYVTTPVIRRLSRAVVRLVNPWIVASGDPDSTVGSMSVGAIHISGAARPNIENLRIDSSWAIGLFLRTCYAGRVTIDRIIDNPGKPEDGRYGYGVLLRGACTGTHISGGVVERARHVFTNDCREAASWNIANIWDHGDTIGTRVEGVTGVGCTGTAFDTHESSVNTVFRNCCVVGSKRDNFPSTSVSGTGFNSRGVWDAFYDCTAYDCEIGIEISCTSIIHEFVGEVVIDGFQFIGAQTNNLNTRCIAVAGNASETTPQRVAVRNLRPGKGSRGIDVNANFTGRISFTACEIAGFYDVAMRLRGNATVDIINCVFDTSEANTSELCISVIDSSTVALNLCNVGVRTKNATTPVALVDVASGSTANIRHINVFEINGTSMVMTAGAGTINKVAITALT